ncbi:MAG: DUF3147 family protein [Candidatus Sulfotelmatobacter sp.]
MKIKVDTTGLRNSKWYEFALRFSFGGAVTAFAGLVAKRYGPEVGGLFLAFPAIVPATATLIRKREQQKKESAGYDGAERGRAAAAVDVAGAAMGGFGLVAFSVIVWLKLTEWKTPIVLAVATTVWFLVAFSIWQLREVLCRQLRTHRPNVLTHTLRPPADRKSVPPRR